MNWKQMMAKFTQKTLLTSLGFCMLLAGPTPLHSEDSGSDPNQSNVAQPQKSRQQTKNRELNSQSEQLALQLVSEHLPQLTPLLQQLKIDQTRQYDRAIVDLARSAKKLNAAQKRDERLFQVELELLKADTEANLTAARLKVRDKLQDRNKLHDAVARLHAAKQAKMQYEVELLRKRLARDQTLLAAAEQNLSTFEEDSSNSVDAVYAMLLRKADRKPAAGKTQNTSDLKTKRRKTKTTSTQQ
jgi:Mg2+ and Co2+ transporter CorA